MPKYNKLALQVLELLSQGLLLGYSRDKKSRRELLAESDKMWLSIDRNELFHALRLLRLKKLVEVIENNDKNTVRITRNGRIRADAGVIMNLKPVVKKHWDKKWRIVIFDVPEERKKIRDSFRRHLKRIGFHEFQKSVFAYPYPCDDEIVILINFHDLKDNVRYFEAKLNYDSDLRKLFNL